VVRPGLDRLITAMSSPARQVALLGGSFDPVHLGHVALAQAALQQLPIDALWWVPVGMPWQKERALTPAPHRVAMLELTIGRDRRQSIETCEIERTGPTYTIDTLRALVSRHPGVVWHLLLGWDQFLNLPTWKQWNELVSRVRLAVVPRPGAATALPPELQGLPVTRLLMAPWDVSSTALRADVAQGRGVLDRVSAPVARYIAEHGLYSNRPSSQELNGHP
jgi:nicotinate-nucleotide adenylyltransferase